MPKKTWIINKFEGGLNSYFNHKDIPANSLTLLKNLNISSVGRVKPVGAEYEELTKEIAAATPGYGLFSFSHDYSIWGGYDVRAAVPGYYQNHNYAFSHTGVTNIWLTDGPTLEDTLLATVDQENYVVLDDPVGLDIYITPIGSEDVGSVISKATHIRVEKNNAANFFWAATFTDVRMGEAQRDYLVLHDNRDILIYQFVENEWIRTIPLSGAGSSLKPVFHFAEGGLRINDANFLNNNSDVSGYGIGQKKLFFILAGEYFTTYGNRDQWASRIVNQNFSFSDLDQFWSKTGGTNFSTSPVHGIEWAADQSGRAYTNEIYAKSGYSYFAHVWLYMPKSGTGPSGVGLPKTLHMGIGNVETGGSKIINGHTNDYFSSASSASVTHGAQRIFLMYIPNLSIAGDDTYEFGFYGNTPSDASQSMYADDVNIIRVPDWMDFPETASVSDTNLISNGSFAKHDSSAAGHLESWTSSSGWTQCGTGYQETATITGTWDGSYGASGQFTTSGLNMATNAYDSGLVKDITNGDAGIVLSNSSNAINVQPIGDEVDFAVGHTFRVQGGSFGLVTTNDSTNHFPYECNQAIMHSSSDNNATRQLSQIFTTPAGSTQDYEVFFQYGFDSARAGTGCEVKYEVSIYTDNGSGSPDSIVKTLLHYDRKGTNYGDDLSFGIGQYATSAQESIQTDHQGATYTDPVSLEASTPYHFVVDTLTDGGGSGGSGWIEINLSNVFVAPLATGQYLETPPVEFSDQWQEGNFLIDVPDATKMFTTDQFSEVQFLIDNSHWGSGSRVAGGSTCLCLREYKDGLGTWEQGDYSIGMAFYDKDGQESHLQIKNNVFTISDTTDTASVKINILLDIFATSGEMHSYWVEVITSGAIGVRWYIAIGQENDWSIVADVNFKDGIRFPGFDYENVKDFLRISPDATLDGILAPYESFSGVMLKSKPTLLRENVIGLKGDDQSFYRYKTSVVHNRRSYIGNILEIDRDGNKLSIGNDLVRKSRLGKYDTFPSSYYLDIGMGDGDSVIKLESYADKLFVFKRNTLYVVVESEGIEYVENTFIGRGIQNITQSSHTPYGIAWMNKAGCYLLGAGEVEILTLNKIDEDEWLSFIDPSSTGSLSTIPSIVYNKVLDQLFVTQSHSSSVLSDTMIYDFTTKSWTKTEGKLIQQDRTNFITSHFSSPITHKGVLSFADNKFYSWDKSSAEASVQIITKCIDFGNPTSNKTIHKVYITYKGGTCQDIAVTYARDGGSFIYFHSPSLICSESSATTVAIFTTSTGSKRCKSFQLKLSGTGASTFEVNDITIVYSEKVTQ